MVYPFARRTICRLSTSSSGKVPCSRYSMNGFVQDGGIFVTMLTKESALYGLSTSAPFTDGVRRCSRKTPGGICLHPDPSLDSRPAALFFSLGTYLTS